MKTKLPKTNKHRIPRKMKKKIPRGSYCYTFISRLPDGFGYKIKLCPFYKGVKWDATCTLFNVKDDFCLYDQCKICDINTDW